MTASERQRKSKKHCVVTALKQYGKTKNPVTPTPPEIENDPPSQNEPRCEKNSDHLSTQNDPQNEENTSQVVARENPQIEGPSGSDKSLDGGPIDKSVLTSFNDHIAYAIWNQTKKATAPEKAQKHDLNATLVGTKRPLAKEKRNTSATKIRKN
ncbi:hypothetical protein LguiA_001443 [Lonicera macranthoides]